MGPVTWLGMSASSAAASEAGSRTAILFCSMT